MQVKSAADLNALSVPPDSPFTVTADVTMTNDERETAAGTVTFETEYERETPAAPEQSRHGRETDPLPAPPGMTVRFKAADVFNNAGSGAEFISASFSTTAYYTQSRIEYGLLLVQAKTAAELSALPSPPESPFTVTVDVTMRNAQRVEATATLYLVTGYLREAQAPDGPAASPAESAPGDPRR